MEKSTAEHKVSAQHKDLYKRGIQSFSITSSLAPAITRNYPAKEAAYRTQGSTLDVDVAFHLTI